jgi:tight adherence protein B
MNVAFALFVGAGVFLTARVFFTRLRAARLERRVGAYVATPQREQRRDEPHGRAASALDALDRALARHPAWHTVEARIERAGITRRPVELFAGLLVATLLFCMLAAAGGSPAPVLLALVVPPATAWTACGILAQRRLQAFDEQLPDLLSALAGSLRSGHGFLHSLQTIAADAPEPAGRELRHVLAETRLGRPVEDALADLGSRIPSRDFKYVLTAIVVQRQVGGSLAGLFDTVNETVRQRQQFTRKVRALTAAGRLSAYALLALPIGLALLLSLVNHHYLSPLFDTHLGRLLILAGATSMLIGGVIVRRIVSLEV